MRDVVLLLVAHLGVGSITDQEHRVVPKAVVSSRCARHSRRVPPLRQTPPCSTRSPLRSQRTALGIARRPETAFDLSPKSPRLRRKNSRMNPGNPISSVASCRRALSATSSMTQPTSPTIASHVAYSESSFSLQRRCMAATRGRTSSLPAANAGKRLRHLDSAESENGSEVLSPLPGSAYVLWSQGVNATPPATLEPADRLRRGRRK